MNVFIVGAGFTKAAIPDAPLNGDLLEKLAQVPEGYAARDLRDRFGSEDIEIALTKLDVETAASNAASDERRLRQRIESELGHYFSRFVAKEQLFAQNPWLAKFVDDVVVPGDVVINLNYDCLLEGALDCRGKWSPNGGYGSSITHPLTSDFPKSPITVLKIHGSSSFVIAPIIGESAAQAVSFVFDEHFFPCSARNTHFGYGAGTGRPYLIAPSYVKIPTVEIDYLRIDALEAASSASNLVVIGTSLRPEDPFLRLLITGFLRHRSWRSRRLVVVDPVAGEIRNRIREFWGVDVSNQLVPINETIEGAVDLLVRSISND